MSSKQLELRVPITKLGNVIETVRSTGSGYWDAYNAGGKKSKQTDLNYTTVPMTLPNNDLS